MLFVAHVYKWYVLWGTCFLLNNLLKESYTRCTLVICLRTVNYRVHVLWSIGGTTILVVKLVINVVVMVYFKISVLICAYCFLINQYSRGAPELDIYSSIIVPYKFLPERSICSGADQNPNYCFWWTSVISHGLAWNCSSVTLIIFLLIQTSLNALI